MAPQINLDRWQSAHLTELLSKGTLIAKRTNRPVEIHRRLLEESDGCYEEEVCTLIDGYVMEQRVVSGGPMPPRFVHQSIYSIDEYPDILMKKSRERFLSTTAILEAME